MARISAASASTGAESAALMFQLATRALARAGVASGGEHSASCECVSRSESSATIGRREGGEPGACMAIVSAVVAAASTSVDTIDRMRPDSTLNSGRMTVLHVRQAGSR